MTVENYVRPGVVIAVTLDSSTGRGRCGHAPPRREQFRMQFPECVSSIEVQSLIFCGF